MESNEEHLNENNVVVEELASANDKQNDGCSGENDAIQEESTGEASSSEQNEESGSINGTCLLCEKFIGPSKSSCVVKERGIRSLIRASIKRKDGKDETLKALEEIRVHKTCYNMYNRESNIKMALEASKKNWHGIRKRRQDGLNFEFSINCFFCSNPVHNWQLSRRVSTQDTMHNVITQLDAYPKTEENKIIMSRARTLKTCNDAYYADNKVVYHAKCMNRFYGYSPCNVKGAPISENMSNVVSFIVNYIVENSDECQFSLKDILEKYTHAHERSELPRLDRIEQHLVAHFGDEIVVHKTTNDRVICFRRTLGKCIENSWYANREKNEKEERKRIVELAAHIILQGIRAMECDLSNYNSPSECLNSVRRDIPETLQSFLDILIKTHKQKRSIWDKRVVSLAHVLMSSVRPRSFFSPILLGLSSMMHTKFSARGLIDCLHNIGLCESYSETIRFETSIVNDSQNFNVVADTYLQFIYDNADHNTATIDGKNNFHSTCGIMCVTPASSVECNRKISRLKGALPKINTNNTSGFLRLTDFKSNRLDGLENIDEFIDNNIDDCSIPAKRKRIL